MDKAQPKSEAPKKVDAPLSKEREKELRKALDEDPMDRFVWKQGDITFSLCASCVHKHPNAATCDAYPRGIPVEFLNGREQHVKPVDGDGGVFYKKVDS